MFGTKVNNHMKFVENGPTIPDDLLIARDAGDVVFFCGAGVSMAYAGLPDFFTLSDTVLNALGAGRTSTARQLLDQARDMRVIGGVGGLIPADRIFGLLEREFETSDIRDEVIKSVRPKGVPRLDAHQILSDLSASRSGKVRLVTTNFDLLFEAGDATLPSVGPPDLIDPKADNFGGIIHLHGRAANDYNGPRESEEFVVSSADFGRAYLADGWATRFMRALLERFVVVFVGYTADDPPMRYLLEALNTHAGSRSQLYAFQSGTDRDTLAMWEHRGVRAIGYDTAGSHAALWDTLAAWAERARNPDRWHEQLLQQAAQGPDKVSAYIRGQIAHLMSTPEGARRIATTDPPLPASWLLVADSRQRYRKPEPEEFGNKDGLAFDPFETLRLDTDAPPKAPVSNDAYSYRDREIPSDAWDGFANNKHDIGTTAGNLRDYNACPPSAPLEQFGVIA
ncbi:SIR2 family protein [Pseudogemmobacter faecipullorum]|uniref:SIR2 family protein n=1 Tax=Pseudogemmobacter faecipullorum TaxID=2755041 RepID=A0ABS8CT05_9RHOB|nr:SIR2 family protein [Pseudogemmobacter faecipullorum]MCB5412290.1 SIR2 family protein [Pseudogemmobacter faecipullorum]